MELGDIYKTYFDSSLPYEDVKDLTLREYFEGEMNGRDTLPELVASLRTISEIITGYPLRLSEITDEELLDETILGYELAMVRKLSPR